MKHTRLALACLLAGLFTGCGTIRYEPRNELARIESLARITSFVGAAAWLHENPQDEPAFQLALNGVQALLIGNVINPAALREALARLPIGELRSDHAAIIITTAVLMLEEAGVADPLVLDSHTKAVALGVRDGLTLAIQLVQPVKLEPKPGA